MSDNVVNITEVRLANYAKEFVDNYERHGKLHAAASLFPRVDREDRPQLRDLIHKEFEKRGYRFDLVEE